MTFVKYIRYVRVYAAMLAMLAVMGIASIHSQSALAQGYGDGPHIQVDLVSESDTVAAGETVMLAFVMRPDKGWHGYWQNPGDAGFGMQPEWKLPRGVSAGDLQYPVPTTLIISELMNYVYERDYAVLVPFDIAQSLTPGQTLDILVDLEWLACTDKVCVPETGSFATRITVGNASSKDRSGQFDSYRKALPAQLDQTAKFRIDGDVVRISIPYPASGDVSAPYLFPVTENAFDYGAPVKTYRRGNMLIVEAKSAAKDLTQIDGVLKISENIGLNVTALPGEVAAGGTLIADSAEPADAPEAGDSGAEKEPAFWLFAGALGGAILGGLLLNIMPCVFPILSLKAISLAKIGGDETAARREGLAYSAGVVLVSVALGGVMLALRAAGEQVGWAFQLQDPRIVLVLLMVVTAISFNLAGLFEVGSFSGGSKLASRGGTSGAFWTGALAAFVATPCAGPFMAVAVGTALILPPIAALLVFAGLGLGLALPFLLLGFIPALRRLMPKPGPWMDVFRKIMSVPMFLTALALLWLLGQQAGVSAMALAIGAALLLALALWWAGIRQRSGKSGIWLATAAALILTVAGAYVIDGAASDTVFGPGPDKNAGSTETLPSQPYSAQLLADLRSEGRPVFAYFTADWCITCKANEAAAIQRSGTADAFASAGITVLKGDWTRRDPEITRLLERYGRSGVPFYIYFPADGEPKILPQLLTPGMLADLAAS